MIETLFLPGLNAIYAGITGDFDPDWPSGRRVGCDFFYGQPWPPKKMERSPKIDVERSGKQRSQRIVA